EKHLASEGISVDKHKESKAGHVTSLKKVFQDLKKSLKSIAGQNKRMHLVPVHSTFISCSVHLSASKSKPVCIETGQGVYPEALAWNQLEKVTPTCKKQTVLCHANSSYRALRL
ncbi:hypothetical protein ATANTOWER_016718, partial [Ataeniobius toweri]|nr:hypothetical protein [Ataeniobius toweri]